MPDIVFALIVTSSGEVSLTLPADFDYTDDVQLKRAADLRDGALELLGHVR